MGIKAAAATDYATMITMRRAVRAIVVRDDTILVMHRNKFGNEYYTLIGGGVEPGEDFEMALVREVAEETQLTVANPRLVYVEDGGERHGEQFIFLTDYVAGEPVLRPDSEEALISKLGRNIYKPMWLPLTELKKANFLSEELKQRILQCVEQGWPTEPQHFNHVQA